MRKMKAIKFAAVVVLASNIMFTCSPAQSAAGVTTRFEKDASLTPEQVQFVLRLARECGLSEPVEITIGRTIPLLRRYVTIKGKEKIDGRRVSFEVVDVYYSKWVNFPRLENAKGDQDFWVYPPYLLKSNFVTFPPGSKPSRVAVSEDISLEVVDRILKDIATGKLRFKDSRDQSRLGGFSASELSALSYDKTQREYVVSFGSPTSCRVRVKLLADGLLVTWGPEFIVY
jgi:hypothetical protein